MENERIRESINLQQGTVGDYLKRNREMRGYSQLEVCDGICSVTVFSRIESGEEVIRFPMLEVVMSRMGIDDTECEFLIAGEDSKIYECREEIKLLFEREAYSEAEERLAAYEKEYGGKDIHNQFLYFWSAILEKNKPQPDTEKRKELLLKAIETTTADYQEKLKEKKLLSSMELDCIVELIGCEENPGEREHRYEDFYVYFQWQKSRDKSFPVPFRRLLKYYAGCLYENGKYDRCIQVCDEVIKELYGTSKVENRWEVFQLRAKARESRGVKDEEEKTLCLSDYLTAYYVASFYCGEENVKMKTLKKYIEEKYGWQFIS